MTTIKTQDLTGPALDWAVAKAEGHQWRCPWILEKEGLQAWLSYERAWGQPHPEYSTDWVGAGDIIEREMLGVMPVSDAWWRAADVDGANRGFGPTALIAAMRCYVVSKLGLIVDVPSELIATP